MSGPGTSAGDAAQLIARHDHGYQLEACPAVPPQAVLPSRSQALVDPFCSCGAVRGARRAAAGSARRPAPVPGRTAKRSPACSPRDRDPGAWEPGRGPAVQAAVCGALLLRSGRNERPACSGLLDQDRGARRRLLPDLPGEFPGLVLVTDADEKELPAPHDGPAIAFQLACQRDRLPVRTEFHPDVPLGDTRGLRLGGLGVHEPLVLRLALGLRLRHRDAGVLPLLLEGVPAVYSGPCRHAVPGQHVAGDAPGVPGGGLGACVQEDLPVARADGDAPADLAADVFFGLAQGQGLRLPGARLAAHGDGDAPVVAACHGLTLTRGRLDSHTPDAKAIRSPSAIPDTCALEKQITCRDPR